MVIVILGILAAVAIPRYADLKQDATDATARGILGALRSANAILFAKRVVGGNAASACFACHQPQKAQDYTFSRLRD